MIVHSLFIFQLYEAELIDFEFMSEDTSVSSPYIRALSDKLMTSW